VAPAPKAKPAASVNRDGPTSAEKVAAALANGPLSRKEIIAATGLSHFTVDIKLKEVGIKVGDRYELKRSSMALPVVAPVKPKATPAPTKVKDAVVQRRFVLARYLRDSGPQAGWTPICKATGIAAATLQHTLACPWFEKDEENKYFVTKEGIEALRANDRE
jgi:hypothetical protein